MIGGAEPLERDRPDGLKADHLQTVGVVDDLVADQDLPRLARSVILAAMLTVRPK